MPAAAGVDGVDHEESKDAAGQLVRAFAAAVECWPQNRDEWGAWKRAFAPLVEQNVTPDDVAKAARSYVVRWPEYERSPFALTKLWQLIQASLEQSYFRLNRWVVETSWLLPDDEVRWVLEQANARAAVDGDEYGRLLHAAATVRLAHADAEGELLRWVEGGGGWALSDDDFRKQLAEKATELGLHGIAASDPKRKAAAIRRECRASIARIASGRHVA